MDCLCLMTMIGILKGKMKVLACSNEKILITDFLLLSQNQNISRLIIEYAKVFLQMV